MQVGLGQGRSEIKAQVAHFRELAWSEHQRPVQVWTVARVAVRDTDREADQFMTARLRNYDLKYAARLSQQRMEAGRPIVAGGTVEHSPGFEDLNLVGAPDRIMDRIVALSAAGLDGVLLVSDEIESELVLWNERIMPLLYQADLRSKRGEAPANSST